MQVSLLYQHRAVPLHLCDHDGRAPLHIACACGHRDLALALVKAGASCSVRDRSGLTPKELAQQNGLSDVVLLMNTMQPVPESPASMVAPIASASASAAGAPIGSADGTRTDASASAGTTSHISEGHGIVVVSDA